MQARFNPQASYEARLQKRQNSRIDVWFQSTGLIRGPTKLLWPADWLFPVSIHRPHTRPDLALAHTFVSLKEFQSTGLIRGPTSGCCLCLQENRVSIHRPHTRPDESIFTRKTSSVESFNPQASYEARLNLIDVLTACFIVSIHRPHTRPDVLPS